MRFDMAGIPYLSTAWDYVVVLVEDNLALMHSCTFNLMLASSLLLYCFYDIPYVNVPEHMQQQLNITDQEVVSSIHLIDMIDLIRSI